MSNRILTLAAIIGALIFVAGLVHLINHYHRGMM